MRVLAGPQRANSQTICPAKRQAPTAHFPFVELRLLAVTTAIICSAVGTALAGEFAAPTAAPAGFRAPTDAPVIDGQVQLTGGPELLSVAGPAMAPTGRGAPAMPITGPSFEQLLDRIDQQDRVIAELQQRLDAAPPAAGVPAWPASSSAANSAYGTSNGTNWAATGEPTCGTPKPPTVYAPLVGDADNGKCPPCGEEKKLKKQHVVTHYVGYDKGFVIKPFNSKEYPFDMKINGRIQFRYNGFARNEETWTDNAGVTREIRNRSDFDIERARLILSGTALDERSTYYLQLDGDTDGSDMVDFFDYWWAWKFSDLLQVQVGKRKVAACRAWLLSAFNTTLVDRSMATDFFRPDRTVGIWFVGDLTENMHYEAMVGNGYRTADMPLSQQNDKFAYAATQWIDLGDGAFGNSFDDYEMHDTPVMQLGHSFAAAQQGDTFGGIPLDESDFVRLSDGTVLDAPSALAPGTRVTDFDLYFYAIDAAFKYRGFAINGELCFRWIDNIGGNGPFPVDKLYDRGFYAQTSYYLVPETLYVAGRVSQVDGAYGNHYEYAGGVGWFLSGNRNQKLTFDVTVLDGSPLNNTTTDILVGDSGLLCRAQYQAMF